MTHGIEFSIEQIAGLPQAKVLALKGQLDESNLHLLKGHVESLLQGEAALLVFECSNLDFLNSRVIGYFISLYSELQARNVHVAFVAVQKDIMKLFTLVGLHSIMHVYASIEELKEKTSKKKPKKAKTRQKS